MAEGTASGEALRRLLQGLSAEERDALREAIRREAEAWGFSPDEAQEARQWAIEMGAGEFDEGEALQALRRWLHST